MTTKVVNEFAIPTGSSGAGAITTGPDGNLWFVESSINCIGEFNPTTDVILETPLPNPGGAPAWITLGPGGTLWFTDANGNEVGEVIAPSIITTAPVSQTIVAGQTATFTAAATGGVPTPTVAWQVSTGPGVAFTPLTNTGVYSGVTTDTLTITGATIGMTGYQYEAVFSNGVAPTPNVATPPAVLTVNPVLSIVPATPQGTIGALYDHTLTVIGSVAPFTVFSVFSFNGGTTGLTFADITTEPSNGTITIDGTPTGIGTATFIIAVANAAGNSLTQNITITIRPPLSIATLSLPEATAGLKYSQAITVQGGALPYTTFNVTGFNAGGTGLTAGEIVALPTAGTFQITGTPTAGGSATFDVNVVDSANTFVTNSYTITVNPPLAITPTLPQGTAGANYDQVLTVTGGGVPYKTFSVASFSAGTTGLVPTDVIPNAAAGTFTVNGTPTAAGTFTFTVNIVDAIGAPLTKTYTVKINPPLTITSSLPQGTAGVNYHQIITVAGGSTPYLLFNITGFSAGTTGLLAGDIVGFGAAGTVTITGTPTGSGTVSFTVNVADSAQSTLTKIFNVTINAAPTIGSLSATQWTLGKSAFSGVLTVVGGTAPFTIAADSGLPTGLTATVTGNTIGFTGTPSAAGAFTAGSITLHDAAGASVQAKFGITINPAPSIGGLTVTQWTMGRSGFTGTMSASGGTGGLKIAGSSGVPTGLTIGLAGNTLSFTGTPTATGTFAGSVTLQDAIGLAITKTFSIVINAAADRQQSDDDAMDDRKIRLHRDHDRRARHRTVPGSPTPAACPPA